MPVKIIVTRYKCACHGELFIRKKDAEACERTSASLSEHFKISGSRKKAPISDKEMHDGLNALFG